MRNTAKSKAYLVSGIWEQELNSRIEAWQSWIAGRSSEMQHPVDFEVRFVKEILTQIRNWLRILFTRNILFSIVKGESDALIS